MAEHIEIKEKKDGSWEIWYPEEGWVACTCDKCKHVTEAPLFCSYYKPTSLEDAQDWLKDTRREIRVIHQPKKKTEGESESKPESKQSKSAKSS